MAGSRILAAIRVCGTGAIASIALAAVACLDDPAAIDTLCVQRGGGKGDPDGILEPGEECDDGNVDDDDGCDRMCRIRCAAGDVRDPETSHCYRALLGPGTAIAALGRCRAIPGGAWRPATVRSSGEETAITTVLAGTTGGFVTAYQTHGVSSVGPLAVTGKGAVTSVAYGEPGLFSGGTVDGVAVGADACSACFGAADPSWGTNGAIVTVDASFRYVEAADDAQVGGAVCELVPPGVAPTLCAPCSSGANLSLLVGGNVYDYFGVPAPVGDAEASCEAEGARLWYVESEAERERVVRAFGPNLRASLTWVGLRRQGDAWAWSDGVTDGENRPSLWALAPSSVPDPTLACAALVPVSGQTYAGGLLAPSPCGTDASQITLAYLCKRPATDADLQHAIGGP